MISPLRLVGQAVVYAGFAALIGYFSSAPAYRYFGGDDAILTVSFSHGAQRKGECHKLSREELAKLPPNMRKPVSCPRERLPVVVALDLDGHRLYEASLPPTGLAKDGPSHVYERFVIPAGRHTLVARLRDTNRSEGFDYDASFDIVLAPAQNLALDFRRDIGGFVLHGR